MTSRIIIGAAAGGLAAAITSAAWLGSPVVAEEPDDPTARFMREKLAAAQSVLEGVVIEDYELIRNGAEKMLAMSQAAEWHVIQGPVYAQHSAEFRRNAETLLEEVKNENLDGANVRYISVTLSCISCHKYVRSTKITGLEEDAAE